MADKQEFTRLLKQIEATGVQLRQETRTGPKITADAVSRSLLARNSDEEEGWMSWMSWNRAPGK
jgi:hypothetical protein